MNLPQQTIDRIEKEARRDAIENYCHAHFDKDVVLEDFSTWNLKMKVAYFTSKRILRAEAIRALPLHEALKELGKRTQANCEYVAKVLALYEAGDSTEPVQGKEAKYTAADLIAFHEWRIESGWTKHSSGEYYYKSKDFHQWPPDETCELSEIIGKWQQSLKQ